MADERDSTEPAPASPPEARRVQVRVALALLEALRDRDRPGEILDDEDVTLTLPRRFGLSGVVDSQIRRYEQDARRGRRIDGNEVRDLMRLVVRRPDAGEIFRQVGRSLTDVDGLPWRRKILPGRMAFALARRRVTSTLRALFGSDFARTSASPFQIEAQRNPLLEIGSAGEPCLLVTGLSETVLSGYREGEHRVHHPSCLARGDARCLWVLGEAAAATPQSPPHMTGAGGTLPLASS